MKYTVAVVFFAAVFGLALCDYTDYQSMLRKYRQSYETDEITERFNRAVKKVCPNKTEIEFQTVLNDIQSCAFQIEVEDITYCTLLKTSVPRCLDSLILMLEDCLPEDSKDLPQHTLKILTSVINYLCRIDGEHIFELANDCVYHNSYRARNCRRRVQARLQQFQNKMPTKEEICDSLTAMKPCFMNHIEDSCGNRITKEAFTGLYEAVFAPCGDINEIETF